MKAEARTKAAAGDLLVMHRRSRGPDQVSEILEVRGALGGPPYLIRLASGRTRLVRPRPGTFEVKPQRPAAASARPATASPGQPLAGPSQGLPWWLGWLAAGFAFAALTLPWLGAGLPGLGWLAAFVLVAITPALISGQARRTARRRAGPGGHPARFWLVAVALTAELIAVAALASPGDAPKRCVDSRTQTVVPAALCENQGQATGDQAGTAGGVIGSGSSPDEWYYGGTGTGVGDPVRGGSVAPPSDDGGGSSSNNSGSDTGGGDDGGGDDGGDDGGSAGSGGGGGE
jgi:Domain of unknown function (DUF1918)